MATTTEEPDCIPPPASGQIACGRICCSPQQYCAYRGKCEENIFETTPTPTNTFILPTTIVYSIPGSPSFTLSTPKPSSLSTVITSSTLFSTTTISAFISPSNPTAGAGGGGQGVGGGLPQAAKIGIGVGVSIIVLILLMGGITLFIRGRRKEMELPYREHGTRNNVYLNERGDEVVEWRYGGDGIR
ncbi:hypothetical protein QBC38DRAFT_207128 [Podospora fimiseda]|uniref:Mid2 domain-containing protein n=1 Tax=Podospora fimiseda TaxID=252190 RepID=A0AAN7BPG8_9PEZI|nr:hypothetical protein QBC38DRAFT_207128 [Podospora fimiseda]